jgi:hypothetical protein
VVDSREVHLPRFVSSREAARDLLDSLGDFTGLVVVVNARNLRSASPSSVDELVRYALVDRGALRLELVSADDPDFNKDIEESAEVHGVQARVVHVSVR